MRDTIPAFTNAEKAVNDTLRKMGLDKITYVGSNQAAITDLGSTKMVIAVTNSISRNSPDSLINKGINVMLLGSAAGAISGDWKIRTSSSNLVPDYAVAYLDSPFVVGNSYKCASGAQLYPVAPANTLTGWTVLGRDATLTSTGYRIALSTERDNIRGAALGYFPEGLTATGWNVVKSMVKWIAEFPVLITSPSIGEGIQPKVDYTITWETRSGIDSVKIEFSVNGGQSWDLVALSVPNTGSFQWTTPNVTSMNCILKITDVVDETATTQRHFEIGTSIGKEIKAPVVETAYNGVISSHSALNFKFSLKSDAMVEFKIYSMAGRLLMASRRYCASGYRTCKLKLDDPLSKGKYISVVKLGNVRFVKSFLVW